VLGCSYTATEEDEMPDHSTPTTRFSRINGAATVDKNAVTHEGGDYVFVIDSDGHYFYAAETMDEATAFGATLGDELGVYVQATVPVGVNPAAYAHDVLGY
jgi:hypothetical protein